MTDKKKPIKKEPQSGIDTAQVAVSLHLVIKDETNNKVLINQRG